MNIDRNAIIERNKNYCLSQPESYYNYASCDLGGFISTDCFELKEKIGKGKYSDVYEGIDIRDNEEIVVKLLKPVRKIKIVREIRILQILKDHPYITQIKDICFDQRTQTPAIVFKKYSNNTLKENIFKLDRLDIKKIMYQIIKATAYAHSKGIINRDLKPGNILIDRSTMNIKIIDWGLSEFYLKENNFSTRVSSRPYKSPELLVNYKDYDFSMDIWSIGCLFGAMIFQKDHLFLGKNNDDQLFRIVKFFGLPNFLKYLLKFKIDYKFSMKNQEILKKTNVMNITSLIGKSNQHLCEETAVDLLKQMLVFDSDQRILAEEAIAHPYFNEVRNYFAQQNR